MSILNENISIKIKDICFMAWDKSRVEVAARNVHALVYRKKGSALFAAGDKRTETNEGDVFYMPAGLSYSADYGEYNEVYVFHFESDCTSAMENFTPSNTNAVGHLFKEAVEIWESRKEGYYFSAMAILNKILKKVSLDCADSGVYEYPPLFLDACTFMETTFTSSELCVESMADMAHISGTYFRKLFLKRYGTTPSKYLNSLRLSHGEKLLSEGRYSVEEVAAMSGFNDVKYFSRQIKKEYGVPPSKLYKFR